MLELITASLVQDDVSLLTEFPSELIDKTEKTWIDYILAYKKKYNVLPKLSQMQKNFDNFSALGDTSLPLQFIYDNTIEEKKTNVIDTLANQILLAIRLNEKESLTLELQKTLRKFSNDINLMSEWERENYKDSVPVLQFPFPTLQELTGGISATDFVNIVGRLGSAKTLLLQWFLRHFAQFNGKKILYISNEMSDADSFLRFDAMIAGFNPLDLRKNGYESMSDKIKSAKDLIRSSGGDIIMSQRRLMTPNIVGELAYKYGVDVIGIDGIYLMKSDEPVKGRFENASMVSNQVKQLTLDLHTPIIATSQLNREGAKETDGMKVEYISLSDSLAQDSDTMLGVQVQNKTKTKLAADVTVMKSRVSGDVIFPVLVDFDTMTITDESGTKVTF